MLLGSRERQIQDLPSNIIEKDVYELLGGSSELLGKFFVLVVQGAVKTELIDEPLALGVASSYAYDGRSPVMETMNQQVFSHICEKTGVPSDGHTSIWQFVQQRYLWHQQHQKLPQNRRL